MGPKFTIGQVIWHEKFGYRGVVIGVDPTFKGTQAWYQHVATSRPPKDRPWYHVLVDGAEHGTYVAERHLEPDGSGEPVEHPQLEEFFDRFAEGYYSNTQLLH